jgi:SAM-dependent methyltransferase
MKTLIKKLVPGPLLRKYRDHQKERKIESYRGDNVICPLCDSHFEKFAPFGVKHRENAICLRCGSLERHRLLWKFLNEKTNLFNKDSKIRLLHFAPEKSFYDALSGFDHIEYFPCDIMPESYSYGGKVEVFKADITSIPFENNYFDVVLCNHVLEHIPDDRKAMSEMYRVMKPGGWSILQVPIDYNRPSTYEDFTITTPAEREKAFGQTDHVRWYGRDYLNRLESVGYKVVEDPYIKSFNQEDMFKFGLMPGEFIYFCWK